MIKTFVLAIFCLNALAAGKKEDTTQSKEIVEIAQNLILQKDREQAIRILNKAQLIEKSKTMQTEIKSILRDIGSLFLYDKAQQEFESSVNFKKTDPSKWLASVEKAQKIEPDNTLIMMEIVRNLINKKSLDKAKETWEEFRVKNPFDKNVIMVSVFLALAAGDVKEIHNSKIKLKDLQLANYPMIMNYLDFLEKVVTGPRERAISALATVKKDDAQNPQIPYWENRLAAKSTAQARPAAPARSEEEPICPTSFPEHYYRRYQYDLFFCSPILEYYFKLKDAS